MENNENKIINEVQERSNKEIRKQGYAAIAGMIIGAVVAIAFFIYMIRLISDLGGLSVSLVLQALLGSLIIGVFGGGLIPGAIRIPALHSKIKKMLFFFPPVGIIIYVYGILLATFFRGWFFMFNDFYKFRKLKKEDK